MSSLSMEDWLGAALSGVDEIATISFGYGAAERLPEGALPHNGVVESVLPILNDNRPVRLSLCVEREACAALARTFLGLDDAEPMPDEHAVDALNEMLNIVAGVVKRELVGRDPSIALGLPRQAKQPSVAGTSPNCALAYLRFGSADVRLSVAFEES